MRRAPPMVGFCEEKKNNLGSICSMVILPTAAGLGITIGF